MHNSSHAAAFNRAFDDRGEIKAEKDAYSFPLLALIFGLMIILLVNAGCTPRSSAQGQPDQLPPGGRLFGDDFSDPPGSWGIWNRDGASVAYYADGLRILVNEPQYDFWSVAGQNFEDVQIEVDATRIGGPEIMILASSAVTRIRKLLYAGGQQRWVLWDCQNAERPV